MGPIERAAQALYELIQPDLAGNPWAGVTGRTREFYLANAAKIVEAANAVRK